MVSLHIIKEMEGRLEVHSKEGTGQLLKSLFLWRKNRRNRKRKQRKKTVVPMKVLEALSRRPPALIFFNNILDKLLPDIDNV